MKSSISCNKSLKQSGKISRKMSRKGQIEITFNWIFVLIAGAVILGFFIMVTKNEKTSTSDKTAREVSAKMESLLSAVQQNPDAVQIQDTLNLELEFKCDQFSAHSYNVKGSEFSVPLDSKIIFAPEMLGDSKTIAWTKLYSSPYPVTYILYFTDEKTQYIFVDSSPPSQNIRDLYKKFPEEFEKNLTTESELSQREDQGYRKYIIVRQASLSDLQLTNSMEKKSTIIGITFTGKIVKFDTGSRTTETFYSNEETLYGAIISGDANLYGCAMSELMHSARIVGEINLERTNRIAEQELSQKCRLFFNPVIQLPQQYITSIIGNSTYAEGENYQALLTAIADLDLYNTNLARSNCPTIY